MELTLTTPVQVFNFDERVHEFDVCRDIQGREDIFSGDITHFVEWTLGLPSNRFDMQDNSIRCSRFDFSPIILLARRLSLIVLVRKLCCGDWFWTRCDRARLHERAFCVFEENRPQRETVSPEELE